MDSNPYRLSSASVTGKPGVLAAQRRLSGLSNEAAAPPASEKPYVAERKVSAAVAKRSSQKADLMQYLAGHSSTVGRMLGTIPEQNAARSSSSTTSILAASAPAALSPATQAAAAAASARRSSISAYLKGQQDLLTTITDGVPYASGVVSMLDGMGDGSNAERGSSSGGSSSSLVSSQSAASIAAAAAVQVNSRQSAVKEALSARISKAVTYGSTSPRFHDEAAGVRQSLIAEGRARRASAAAVLPPTAAAGGSPMPPGTRSSTRTSQFYPTGPAAAGNIQLAAYRAADSLICPQVIDYGQYATAGNRQSATAATAAEAAWLDAFGTSNPTFEGQGSAYANAAGAPAGSDGGSSSDSDGSSDGSETGEESDTEFSESEQRFGSRVQGWKQRASVVTAAKRSSVAHGVAPRGSMTAKRASVTAAAIAAARRASESNGQRRSSAAAAKVAAAAAAAAASAVARQSAIQKQKGVKRMSLNRWSSKNSSSNGRRSSASRESDTAANASSSSTSRRGSNSSSSSDGAKCIAQVRRSMQMGQSAVLRRQSSSIKYNSTAFANPRSSSICNAARRYAAPRQSMAARVRAAKLRRTESSSSSGSSDTSRRVSQALLSRRSSSAAAAAARLGPGASRSQQLQRAQAKRRLLAVSMLQKVGRQLQVHANRQHSSSDSSSASSRSSSGEMPAVRRSSLSASAAAATRRASLAAAAVAAKRASTIRTSTAVRASLFGRTAPAALGRSSVRVGRCSVSNAGGWSANSSSSGAASAARQSRKEALETMLNPKDKPSHRLSLTDHDAAAVVLGRTSSGGNAATAPARRSSVSQPRRVFRRTTSSSGSSRGGSFRRSSLKIGGGSSRRVSQVQASSSVAAARRSVRAPSVMVRPGRKTWVQVYEEAVGTV